MAANGPVTFQYDDDDDDDDDDGDDDGDDDAGVQTPGAIWSIKHVLI